jgi:transposase-like protein
VPHTKEPPIVCPKCQNGVGRANAVTMTAGHKIVRYVCTECDHEWNVTTRDPDEMLKPGA